MFEWHNPGNVTQSQSDLLGMECTTAAVLPGGRAHVRGQTQKDRQLAAAQHFPPCLINALLPLRGGGVGSIL